ncbi:MAG: hypothetical protein ACK4VO_10865 [Pseudobdellovibrio sp.]
MGKFLDWYSAHNAIIIQSLAVVIALLIIFFIFRLFFSKSAVETQSGHRIEFNYDVLEDKINKLLEQHSQMKVSVASGSGEVTPEQIAEMNQLKAEMNQLKETLTKKETELAAAKEQSAGSGASGDQLDALNNKISEYEKQISKLNNRLSEYEIIAEDIADLQKYKTENEQLKKQVSEVAQAPKSSDPAPVSVAAAPATPSQTVSQSQPEIPAPVAPAVTAAPAASAPTPAPAASEGKGLSLQQDEIDKLLNGFSAEPTASESAPASKADEVSAADAQSLDDFEKNFQKG